MRWIAVAYGALAGLILASLSIGLGLFAPYERFPDLIPAIIMVNRMLALISYAVAGAVAGGVAMKFGALHGALAALLAGVAGRVLAFALITAMYGRSALDAQLQNWISSVGWLAVGVAIGAVAGAITAAHRARSRTAAVIAP